MRKSTFSESQIVAILNEAEGGVPVSDVCRSHGMSQATFYKWRTKYGGMDANLMRRLKDLETENTRLKKMFADSQLDNLVLRESLIKKQ